METNPLQEAKNLAPAVIKPRYASNPSSDCQPTNGKPRRRWIRSNRGPRPSKHSALTTDLVGARVRFLRARQGLSQQRLSCLLKNYRVGVSREVVANWESARSTVPAWVLSFLAYLLDADLTDFFPARRRVRVSGDLFPPRSSSTQ